MPEDTVSRRSAINMVVKFAGLLVLAVGILFVYFWDDVFFAAPMIAVSSLWGALPSFLILFPLYWIGEFFISRGCLNVYDRVSTGEPSRLEKWLKKTGNEEAHSKKANKAKRIIEPLFSEGWVRATGFVLACFVLGGIAVTMILRYAGRREGIVRTAFWASFWFALTFVGFYSGMPQIVINLVHKIF